MPSLKKSPSVSKKIGSPVEDYGLKDAIDFLFQIKGIQFTRIHSDFIPPCAEEFLSYTLCLDIHPTKKRSSQTFQEFLTFLTPMDADSHACATILSNMCIVLYALTLYTSVSSYLVQVPVMSLDKALALAQDKVTESGPSPAGDTATMIHNAFHEYITTYMPYIPKQAVDTIMKVSDEFVRRSRVQLPKKVPARIPALNLEIGTDMCIGLDAVYTYESFFLQWKALIAVLLTRCGVTACRSVCEEIAEYVKTKL